MADGQVLGNRATDVNTLDIGEICDMGLTDGTRYFFLSIVGISVLSAFSQMTYREQHAQHAADKWAA